MLDMGYLTDVWRLTYKTGGHIGVVWGYDEEEATRELIRLQHADDDVHARIRDEGGWCMEPMTRAEVLSWAVHEHRRLEGALMAGRVSPEHAKRSGTAVSLYARATGQSDADAMSDILVEASR